MLFCSDDLVFDVVSGSGDANWWCGYSSCYVGVGDVDIPLCSYLSLYIGRMSVVRQFVNDPFFCGLFKCFVF